MTALKTVLFFIGVLIVLAGLSMMLVTRVNLLRQEGQSVQPEQWATLVDALARFWSQIIGGVGEEYRTGFTVLVVGVIVMVVPIALPKPSKS